MNRAENKYITHNGREITITVDYTRDRSHCRKDYATLWYSEGGRLVEYTAKAIWCNRTWETYHFQQVRHNAIYAYVEGETGITNFLRKRGIETRSYKSRTAEGRRLEKVAAIEAARRLYEELKAKCDGRYIEPEPNTTPNGGERIAA